MSARWNYWNRFLTVITQIDTITDPEKKNEEANKFLQELSKEYSGDPKHFVDRILEIASDVNLVDVPESLMHSLQEAIFCYVNDQFLSSIAASGITAELFCVHIYQLFLENAGASRLQGKSALRRFRNLSQSQRIAELKETVGVDEDICGSLDNIREKRNNAVHPGEGFNYQHLALDCLQDIIDVLNLYSKSREEAIIEANKSKESAEKPLN